ncbi:proline dehydrogenase [Trypanosoma rangeli]|uniref:Proline dehydrogenase n=1 Tax=Trypanosoma rangeli TaxID=5698 RepID=A0A3R7N3G7_TRYRA|nr:proline dehydrogenase [Trypanosoma rangeli]RNE99492.1 proline dehydrogenase [Trypanosoma rangeli]|eukprot:RNE99492.1 proline dehydrogenase [Trypanosoma rangeli]
MFRNISKLASKVSQELPLQSRKIQPVNFYDDTVFREKSLWGLIRALCVLRVCQIQYLCKNSVALMKRSEKIVGPFLTYDTIVRATVYSHFCAGTDERELKKTVKALEKQGIGSVLDYAAEADVEGFVPAPGAKEAPNLSMASLVDNTSVKYVPHGQLYDENMKLYIMCVMHASLNQPVNGVGLAAVKVTGMCDPQLLARVSAILHSVHYSWMKFFAHEKPPPLEECHVVMGTNKEHQLHITREQLIKGFTEYGPARKYTEQEVEAVIKALDDKNEGKVNYYRFKKFVSEAVLAVEPTSVQKLIVDKLPKLTEEERELWRALHKRLSVIVRTARDLRVRVLFDAEQTFYQLAIDSIVVQFQREFNKKEPIVYNTYQCYLTYTEDRVFNDLTRAMLEGWVWGGKVVRGAYMDQERETATRYNYKSPVWPTYEETSACYQACAKRILDEFVRLPNVPFEVLFGTHNKASVHEISETIMKLPSVKGGAVFAQLYGMADHLTIPLKKAGFRVFKYVPYGPVKETVHYLGRRASENSAVLDKGGSEEVQLMKKELRRRLFWFMKE